MKLTTRNKLRNKMALEYVQFLKDEKIKRSPFNIKQIKALMNRLINARSL